MSEIEFIRRFGEHTRQCVAIRMLEKIIDHPQLSQEAKQAFADIWADWERNEEFRNVPDRSDAPEVVWANIENYMRDAKEGKVIPLWRAA